MECYKEIKTFLDGEGRLTAFPAKRKKKIIALFYLAEKVESGKRYTEREINDLLLAWHLFRDPATLRRELYDYGFLCRAEDGSVYWKSETQPDPKELGIE